MKIKVGDKVRFRSDLKVGEYYGGCVWNEDNDNRWLGKEAIVSSYNGFSFEIENYGGSANFDNAFRIEMLDQNYHGSSKIYITTDGRTVHAVMKRGGEVVKCSKAVCNPEDEFDLLTGAKIAIERLEEKPKSKFIPYLLDIWKECASWEDCSCGIIGEPVAMTLAFGEPLYVGDVVEVYNTSSKSRTTNFILKPTGEESFVQGLQGYFFKNGIYSDWQIRRVKSYRELKNRERINNIVAVLREE